MGVAIVLALTVLRPHRAQAAAHEAAQATSKPAYAEGS